MTKTYYSFWPVVAAGTDPAPDGCPVDVVSGEDAQAGRYVSGAGRTRIPWTVSAHRRFACARWMLVIGVMGATACVPMYQKSAQEVETKPPRVSYDYTSDAGLIDANSKARNYCSQYGSLPHMLGSITEDPDGTRKVTFECINTAGVATYPSPVPAPVTTEMPPSQTSYSYRTDTQLLDALDSADSYCARTGETASSRIVTNSDGTKTLTYHCIAR
jgi:hypothetical protein